MPSTSYYQTPPAELYEHPGPMHQPSVISPPTQQQTTQTIDTTNPPIQPQPQQQQMQSPNTQLVPSIPSAQHIDHYSPYYTPGYSHSGGQCFTPSFMGKQKYGKLYQTFTFLFLFRVFFLLDFVFVFFCLSKTLIIFVPINLVSIHRIENSSVYNSVFYVHVCVCACGLNKNFSFHEHLFETILFN